jgi:hypothetical protein
VFENRPQSVADRLPGWRGLSGHGRVDSPPPSIDRPPSGKAPYRSCSYFPGYHLIIIGILPTLFSVDLVV